MKTKKLQKETESNDLSSSFSCYKCYLEFLAEQIPNPDYPDYSKDPINTDEKQKRINQTAKKKQITEEE